MNQNALQVVWTCSHIPRETQLIKARSWCTPSMLPGRCICLRARRELERQRRRSRGTGGMECVSRAATTESQLPLRPGQRLARGLRRLAPALTCPTPLMTRSLHNSLSLGIGRKGRMRTNLDIGDPKIPYDILNDSGFTLSNWRAIDDSPPPYGIFLKIPDCAPILLEYVSW